MAFDLGQARGEIVIDASGATRGVRQAQQAINGLGQSSQTVGFGLQSLGGALIGIGGAATLGIGAAVREAAAFEEALANVSTLSELVAENTSYFGEEILRVSRETNRSANDLALAFYEIVSAAIEGDQALLVLAAASSAANAGLTDTTTASNVLTSVLNSGITGLDLTNFTMEDLTRVSDILFQSVNRGVFTFQELAVALGDSLPLATGLGISLEETGAAFAIITRNGQTASEASTQINATLSALLKPSKSLTVILGELGFESGQAAIEQLGFAGALEAIENQIATTGREVDDFSGNIRAVRGFLSLTNSAAGDFSEEVASIGGAAGATNRALEEQAKTFQFAVNSFTNAVRNLGISVGSVFLPVLTKIVNGITNVVKFLDELPKPVKAALAGFIVIAGGALLVLGVMAILASQIIAISAAFQLLRKNGAALGGSLGRLLGPVRAIGDGFADIGGSSNAAGRGLRSVGASAQSTGRGLSRASNASGALVDQLKKMERSLPKTTPRLTEFSTNMKSLQAALKGVPSSLTRMSTALEKLPSNLAKMSGPLAGIVPSMTALAKPAKDVGSGFRGLAKSLPNLATDLRTLPGPLAALAPSLTAIADPAKKVGTGFASLARGTKDLPAQLAPLPASLAPIAGALTPIEAPLKKVSSGFSRISRASESINKELPNVLNSLNQMGPVATRLATPLSDVAKSFSRMKSATTGLPTPLMLMSNSFSSMKYPMNDLAKAVGPVANGMKGIATAAKRMTAANFPSLPSAMIGFSMGVNGLNNAMGNAPANLGLMATAFGRMSKSVATLATDLPGLVKPLNDIDGPISNLSTSLKDTPDKMNLLSRSFASMSKTLPNLVQPLTTVSLRMGQLKNTVGDLPTKLGDVSKSFSSMSKNIPLISFRLPMVVKSLDDLVTVANVGGKDLDNLAQPLTVMSRELSVIGKRIAPVIGQVEAIGLAASNSFTSTSTFATNVAALGLAVENAAKQMSGKAGVFTNIGSALTSLGASATSFDAAALGTKFDELVAATNKLSVITPDFNLQLRSFADNLGRIGPAMSKFAANLPAAGADLGKFTGGMQRIANAVNAIDATKLATIATSVGDLGRAVPRDAQRIQEFGAGLRGINDTLNLKGLAKAGTLATGFSSLSAAIGSFSTTVQASLASVTALDASITALGQKFTSLNRRISAATAQLIKFNATAAAGGGGLIGLGDAGVDAGKGAGKAAKGTKAAGKAAKQLAIDMGLAVAAVDSFYAPARGGAIRGNIVAEAIWQTSDAVDDLGDSSEKARRRYINLRGELADAPDVARGPGRISRLIDRQSRPIGAVAQARPGRLGTSVATTLNKSLKATKAFGKTSAKQSLKFIKDTVLSRKNLAALAGGLLSYGKVVGSVGVGTTKKFGGALQSGVVRGARASGAAVKGLSQGIFRLVIPMKLIGRWLNLWKIGFKAIIFPIKAAIFLIQGLASALFFLLSPLGFLLIAIGFFAAAFLQNWFGIRDKLTAVIDGISNRVNAFIDIFNEIRRISTIFNTTGSAATAMVQELNRLAFIKFLAEDIANRFGLSSDATERLRQALAGLQANIAGLRISARKAEIGLSAIFDYIQNGPLAVENFTTAFRFLSDAFGGEVAKSILNGATELREALGLFRDGEGAAADAANGFFNFFKVENLFTNLAKAARSFARFVRFDVFPAIGKLVAFFLKFAAVVATALAFFIDGDYEAGFRAIGEGVRRALYGIADEIEGADWGRVFDTVSTILSGLFMTPIKIGAALISFTPELASGIWGAAGDAYSWLKDQIMEARSGGPVGDNTGISQSERPITIGAVLLSGIPLIWGALKDLASDFNNWLMTQIFGEDYSDSQQLPQNIGEVVLDGAIGIGSTIADWIGNGIENVKDWFYPIYDLITIDAGEINVTGLVTFGSTENEDPNATGVGTFASTVLGSVIDALWSALDGGELLVDGLEWANGVLDRINEWMLMVDFDENAFLAIGAKVGSAINRALSGDNLTLADEVYIDPLTGLEVTISPQQSIGDRLLNQVITLLLNILENRAAIAIVATKITAALGAFIGGVIMGAATGITIDFAGEDYQSLKDRIKYLLEDFILQLFLDIIPEINVAGVIQGSPLGVIPGLAELAGDLISLPGDVGIQGLKDVTAAISYLVTVTPNIVSYDAAGNARFDPLLAAQALETGLRGGEIRIGADGIIRTTADMEVAVQAGVTVDVTDEFLQIPDVFTLIEEYFTGYSTEPGGNGLETGEIGGVVAAFVTAGINAGWITGIEDADSSVITAPMGKKISDGVDGAEDEPAATVAFALLGRRVLARLGEGISSSRGSRSISTAFGKVTGGAAVSVASQQSRFVSAGAALAQGLAIGMLSRTAAVVQAAQFLANAANNAFRGSMRIQSPSKVWSDFGGYMGEGLAVGMESSGAIVARASDVLAARATPTAVPYGSLSGVGATATATSGPVFNNAVIYMPNAETADAVATYFMNYSRSRR